MFPNVRLLIGALVITVLVLSCEFGVFAALRVNREPLSRLTSEGAPLQLVAATKAPPAVTILWSAPINVPAPAGGMQTGIVTAEAPAAQPAERAIEVPAPSSDGAAGTLDKNNQTNPAVLQTALAPAPAIPAPAAAPVADAPVPMAQAPIPPPVNSPAPINEAAPVNPDASVAPVREVPIPAVSAAVGNGASEQTAAAPAAVAVQQAPAAEIVKPAEAQPVAAEPIPQPHETAAQVSEPPAGGAPAVAAIAPAAAEPMPAQPAEITGSLPNAAMPESAAPKAEAPHAKPFPKAVHKPAVKKPHKVARAPAQVHHALKKRTVRRGRAPAAASSAQTANNFDNPVFQSAPELQRQTRSRPTARNAATNTGFNTFGTQFGTH
jgi:hypothetical protein